MNPQTRLTIPKPDDWHLHIRDGAMMQAVLPDTARHFARAVIMPNLKPPIVTTADAAAYRDRVRAAIPHGVSFTPLMTAYLTDATDPDDLECGFEEGVLFGAKLYPAGVTTNSDNGVTDIQNISVVLDRLQRIGMPLLLHGEVADPDVDFFDREAVFVDRILSRLRRNFPDLRIVLEHVSTQHAVQYVIAEGQSGKLAATITPHHLLYNRNTLFEGGLSPHNFCLPVLKRETDRLAVVEAATSGASMFFAGTDSAPHPRTSKERDKAAGGIYSAPNALALYAEIFEKAEALDRIASFLSLNGAAFYGLPVNEETLTLEKGAAPFACAAPLVTQDGDEVVPFPDGKPLHWCVAE